MVALATDLGERKDGDDVNLMTTAELTTAVDGNGKGEGGAGNNYGGGKGNSGEGDCGGDGDGSIMFKISVTRISSDKFNNLVCHKPGYAPAKCGKKFVLSSLFLQYMFR